ncbi:hypothetical protein PsYK624_097520 [Phanerochaete sordida]|uniref:Uncharacterized protein n=1 Tax=Phanerochaete sordida TaxID=48140 RepID=A0A9P3GDB2_9APHY|nr:hypothetical protein PsYK624_097520 [Phanerochaete sordida]
MPGRRIVFYMASPQEVSSSEDSETSDEEEEADEMDEDDGSVAEEGNGMDVDVTTQPAQYIQLITCYSVFSSIRA